MWELYDDLIDGMAPDAVADEIICGCMYTVVFSGGSAGFAETRNYGSNRQLMPRKRSGLPLRELAGCVKSWNFREASIGQAAINAWYNAPGRLAEIGVKLSDARYTEDRKSDPFITMQRELAGKSVVIIGHFPYIDKLLRPVCRLTVVGNETIDESDLPEQAAEYMLPESDYAFIKSYTICEKTLPHYLELARGSHVTLVGPSVPVAPVLQKYGVNMIASAAVRDAALTRAAALGMGGNVHAGRHKVLVEL
jgi:uncharacterized protein (DUF4213/DUF364 family)